MDPAAGAIGFLQEDFMKQYLDKSLDFEGYLGLIDQLLGEGKSTGPNQSDSLLEYSKLNRHRMNRIRKTTKISATLEDALRYNRRNLIWLILTEGWCGDAAQAVPVIEEIAARSANIETRYVLRDENPELMDAHLTNGARSIPKLIAIDADSGEIVGTWGPRPAAGTAHFMELKKRGLDKGEISELMQRWYNEDRGGSIQNDFEELLRNWNAGESVGASN
jgi:hypothetical protein